MEGDFPKCEVCRPPVGRANSPSLAGRRVPRLDFDTRYRNQLNESRREQCGDRRVTLSTEHRATVTHRSVLPDRRRPRGQSCAGASARTPCKGADVVSVAGRSPGPPPPLLGSRHQNFRGCPFSLPDIKPDDGASYATSDCLENLMIFETLGLGKALGSRSLYMRTTALSR